LADHAFVELISHYCVLHKTLLFGFVAAAFI